MILAILLILLVAAVIGGVTLHGLAWLLVVVAAIALIAAAISGQRF